MSYAGLAKQTADIRLGGGIDEANHPFVVDSPAVLNAQNVRVNHRGALAKRAGYSIQSQTGRPSQTVENNCIFEHEGTLVVWHPDGPYLQNENKNTWQRTNSCAPRPTRLLTDPIIRGNDTLRKPDIAVSQSENIACVVWEDEQAAEVRYAFFDTTLDASGRPKMTMLGGPKAAHSSLKRHPKIVCIGSGATFVIIAHNGNAGGGTIGDVYAVTYTISADTYTFGSATAITGVTSQAENFDVATDGGTNYHIASLSGATDTLVTQCTSAGATGTTEVISNFRFLAIMVNTVLSKIVLIGGDQDTVFLSIAHVASNYSGSATVASLVVVNTNIKFTRGTLSQYDATGQMFAVISGEGITPAQGSTNQVGAYAAIINTSMALSKGSEIPTLTLMGKAAYAFDLGTGVESALVPMGENIGGTSSANAAPYGVVCRPVLDDLAGTLRMVSCGKFLVDRLEKSRDTGGTLVNIRGHLSSMIEGIDGELWFVAPVLTEATFWQTDQAKRQVDLVRVRPFHAPPCRNVTARSLRLFASGAGLVAFDGQQLEDNTPPRVSYLANKSSGTGDPSFTYDSAVITGNYFGPAYTGDLASIRLVHRWVDAQGNIHRGAPSAVLSADMAGGPNNTSGSTHNGMQVVFTPVVPTGLQGDRLTYLDVEVYQCETPTSPPATVDATFYLVGVAKPVADGTLPFFYISLSLPTTNVLPPQGVEVFAHTSLVNFPSAYFNEDAENTLSPPLLDVCSTQNRLWAIDAENRLSFRWTKPIVEGRSPEFASEFVEQVPHEGGDCVGIAAMADRVIIFKERQAYTVFGDPGDAAGSGSTLQKAQLIPGDIGCTNVNSIVEGPGGIYFLSAQGFYLLTPGLEFQFIGEQVRDTLGTLVVTSGVHVPAQSEIRWTLDSNGRTWDSDRALVYNYRVGAWSLWTDFEAVHACVWRGDYTRLAQDTLVYKETPGSWADGASFESAITTAWIKLAGLQGFQRIWRAVLLLRWYTGAVRIQVAYDYDETVIDTFDWTAAECGALGAASGGRLQLAFRPTRQKCEAMKLTITERPVVGQTVSAGRGIELIALELECGIKRGSFKQLVAGAKK